MEVNVLEHIDSDTGEFKDSFREQIPVIAGEEFKDTKLFDQIKNLNNLVKTYAHTQRAYDTKMEGVIKPPKEDASDEEKTQFKASLLKLLGVPEKADDYEFPRPNDMPKEAVYSEETEKVFREIFHKHGLTKEAVADIVNEHNRIVRQQIDAHIKEKNDRFEADSTALKNDWKGDTLIQNARIAYNAMNQFIDDDFKAILKESKIYDNAGDLAKWREIDVLPRDLKLWANIGMKMKSPDVGDEGGDKGGKKTLAQKVYTHPSSEKLFVKK